MQNILITGITGKSGTYMLKKMIEESEYLKGYNFGFVVRKTSKTEELKNAPINKTIYIGDIDNSNDIDKILTSGGVRHFITYSRYHIFFTISFSCS